MDIASSSHDWQVHSVQQPQIILSHETFNSVGSWAITPILASSSEYIDKIKLSSDGLNAAPKTKSPPANATTANAAAATSTASETKWLILCEDQSIVDLKALINNLKNEDYTKVSNAIPMRFFASCSSSSVLKYGNKKINVSTNHCNIRNVIHRIVNLYHTRLLELCLVIKYKRWKENTNGIIIETKTAWKIERVANWSEKKTGNMWNSLIKKRSVGFMLPSQRVLF